MGRRSFLPALSRKTGLTRGALTAISTIVPVGIAIGLLPPLLALTLSDRGVSARMIGILVSVIAVAALFAAPQAAKIGGRYGVARTIAGTTLIAAFLVPVFWYVKTTLVLFPMAFIYGSALTVCFSLSEYWINAATPSRRRGLVMGIYASILSVGFAIGPGILAITGTGTARPFLIGSAILALASLPVLLSRHRAPDYEAPERQPFMRLVFAAPAATFGVLVFAAAEGGGFSFLPLWGRQLGYPETILPLLASAMTLGNVAFQIPLGLLSDRVDRRHVLAALGAFGAIGMAAAWLASGSPWWLMAILFVWGGATAGLYTVGLAHLAGRFSGADLAGATSAFVFCYAVGMLIGPLAIGEAMTRLPLTGLPLVLGSGFVAYTGFMMVRLTAAKRARA